MQQKVYKFVLRTNFVDIYNYDMNSVDRADHLRTNYPLGQGLRQRNRWWSIFLWVFDVNIVTLHLSRRHFQGLDGY